MEDFFKDLYDDNTEGEPSFSIHDFKKWLSQQKKPKGFDKISESIEQDKKDDLTEKFKARMKDRKKT